MELCKGGNLHDDIMDKDHYDEFKALDVIRQISSALEFLHSHNITHGDLKVSKLIFFCRFISVFMRIFS